MSITEPQSEQIQQFLNLVLAKFSKIHEGQPFPFGYTKFVVENAIRIFGPITRSELVQITKIPRTTIYDTIVKLMLDKKVRKYSVPSRRRGRPRVFYELIPLDS
jgi:hypothetical protein